MVMKTASKLGGAISGEHGIGLTKIGFLDRALLDDYLEYVHTVDPARVFTAASLSPTSPAAHLHAELQPARQRIASSCSKASSS